MEKRKITSLLISKPLLRPYLILIIVIMLLTTLLVGVTIHQTIKGVAKEEAERVEKISVYEVLGKASEQLITRVFIILCLTILATAASSVVFLHKISGPMLRIHRILRHLAEGEIPTKKVSIRESDFFQEIASELNRVIERMRSPH